MDIAVTDPVASLRAELRRSLLRPSLPRRLWCWLVFGQIPMEHPLAPAWRVPDTQETRLYRTR